MIYGTLTISSKKPLPRIQDPSHAFWANNGSVLTDLRELHNALENMDADTFAHHVSEDKNDFAEWIHHALAEPAIAKKIRRFKTVKSAFKAVRSALKEYE